VQHDAQERAVDLEEVLAVILDRRGLLVVLAVPGQQQQQRPRQPPYLRAML
jgi:hypothetical protein